MAEQVASTVQVERRSIDPIPPEERHGRPRGLFAVWFAANTQMTALVTGALGVLIGLSLPYAVLAIVVGNLIGAVFMALHSAQGPKLGIPQMIQSRAQFGFYGAIVPIVIVVLMYIGFFAASGVLGGDALAEATGVPSNAGIIIVAMACVIFTVIGYRLIHALERVASVLSAAAFLLLTVALLNSYDLGPVWKAGPFHFGLFLLMIAIAATWQISYAPYVADYSRYLPESTSIRSCFWWSYGGSVVGTVWMMFVGAVAAAVGGSAFDSGSTSFIVDLAPTGTRWFASAAIILGVVAVNVLNLYGAFMSVITSATAVRPFHVTGTVRTGVVTATAAVGTIMAIIGKNTFIDSYENFILFLTYFLVPWTAINLVDFYLVRKERYVIADIFTPHGIYGAFSWQALCAYGVGIAVEIPFMSTSFYTGPMVAHLGGADISWILGLILSAGVFYLAMRPEGARSDMEASREPATSAS
jgi:nucleobase:cation symporter-1, NCS1 family